MQEKSVEIGRAQMNAVEEGWPSSFNDTLSKNVVAMSVIRKALKINAIYSRVLVLQQSKDIDLTKVLHYV